MMSVSMLCSLLGFNTAVKEDDGAHLLHFIIYFYDYTNLSKTCAAGFCSSIFKREKFNSIKANKQEMTSFCCQL